MVGGRKQDTSNSGIGAGRECRGAVRGTCSNKGSVDSGKGISTKDEVAGDALGQNLKVIVVTAEPVQMEKLGEGDGELGMGWVGRGEVKYECESVYL